MVTMIRQTQSSTGFQNEKLPIGRNPFFMESTAPGVAWERRRRSGIERMKKG